MWYTWIVINLGSRTLNDNKAMQTHSIIIFHIKEPQQKTEKQNPKSKSANCKSIQTPYCVQEHPLSFLLAITCITGTTRKLNWLVIVQEGTYWSIELPQFLLCARKGKCFLTNIVPFQPVKPSTKCSTCVYHSLIHTDTHTVLLIIYIHFIYSIKCFFFTITHQWP